jgi:hypothetical protein
MPNVPTFISDKNIAVSPRVEMPAPSAAAMGAGLFQGAMNAAGEVGAAWEQVQRQRDDLAASSAYTEYAGMVGQYLHGQTGPNGSVVPGALASQGRGAQNITVGFADRVKNLDSNYMKKLTPDQYRLWKQRADILTQNTLERLTVHEADQMRKGDIEEATANADAMLRESVAGNNWSNGDTFENVYMAPMRKNLETALTRAGMHPAMVREKVAEAERGAVINRVQAAIGARSWESAAALLDDPRINDEQRGMLRHNIEAGMERAKREAEQAAAKDKHDFEVFENNRFASRWMDMDWTDELKVRDFEDELRASGAPHIAMSYYNNAQSMRAAVAKDMQKSAEERQKERASEQYRVNIVSAENGVAIGRDGRVRVMAPAEHLAMLDQQVMSGAIKLEDRNRIAANVTKKMTAREGDFTKRAITEVMPNAMQYFAMKDNSSELSLDSDGSLIIGRQFKTKFFKPQDKTGYQRKYLAPGSGGEAKKKVDALTIENIQDALSMVREQLRADPKMSVPDAVELFRRMTVGDAKQLAIGSFDDQMRERAELVRKMNENMYRAHTVPRVAR